MHRASRQPRPGGSGARGDQQQGWTAAFTDAQQGQIGAENHAVHFSMFQLMYRSVGNHPTDSNFYILLEAHS